MQRSQSQLERLLTPEAKKALIGSLAKADDNQLFQALMHAAFNPNLYRFPPQVQAPLGSLQRAYQEHQHNEAVAPHLKTAIESHMKSVAIPQMKLLLQSQTIADEWQSEFLYYLAGELKIEIQSTPLVQATIKDGKVYWRIVKAGDVIYERPCNARDRITFTEENSWFSDWETFRLFKDSGKRYSPVAITKQRLIDALKDKPHASEKLAKQIWNELKKNGVLTAKNKLSAGWRAMSQDQLHLKAIEKITVKTHKKELYKTLGRTLMQLANTQAHAEKIDRLDNAIKFRPERTQQNWSESANVYHADRHSQEHSSKLWDVAIHGELDAHRNTETEVASYGMKLNYDHIPASAILGHSCGASSKAYEVTELAYTIAIPELLHKDGATHMVLLADQIKHKGNVFLNDVNTHLTNIEASPDKYHLTGKNDYLQAVGAFRTMYHIHLKPEATVPGTTNKLGGNSSSFFSKTKDKQEIDKMFISKMQETMKKR